MAKGKSAHPVRLVRDALKNTPEELKLRQYATAAGFARLLGRSPSLVRNVECGITRRWDALALLIEQKTKVSRQWLLSSPKEGDPIQDVRGKPWVPARYLDPLAPRDNMPDWRFLLHEDPTSIPDLIAKTIRAQLILELSFALENGISNMVSLFFRMGTFANPGLKSVLNDQRNRVENSMGNRVWSRSPDQGKHQDLDLEARYGIHLNSLTLEQMERVLQGEGVGWASKLQHLPEEGILADAAKFYAKRYPNSQSSEMDDDELTDSET
ncbi:MAG: hypothetical protein WCK77_00500 [Verrucomicrobiota bacterium]